MFRVVTLLVTIGFVLGACLLALGQMSDPFYSGDTSRSEAFARIIRDARRSGPVRVIVGIRSSFVPEGWLAEGDIVRQRSRIRRGQRSAVAALQRFGVSDVMQFEFIPFFACAVDAAALEWMRDNPEISSVQKDVAIVPGLVESIPIVGAAPAWSAGFSGNGQTVAILDTGVDKNHSFLTGRVISEACYSGSAGASLCPGGVTASTAVDSGLNCPVSIDGCGHGTHVAGIAAGRGTSFNGVAKDANIIAIQIFSVINVPSGSPILVGGESDMLNALERVRTLAGTMNNIAAVNLSLQTGEQFTTNCDGAHAATKAAIDNLLSLKIATIVASGNSGFTSALTSPACISTAVSVGSTDDGSLGTTADAVSSFSNSSNLLHLLAPGQWINSSVPGNVFENEWGTSMAAPHVAGAFAVLRQRRPSAHVNEIRDTLLATGQPITDSRNSIVKPRINVFDALQMTARKTVYDYDGDGKSDVSTFRPEDGVWYLNRSTAGVVGLQWGTSTDKLAPADYDGDAKTDVAVYRPSEGRWYIFNSSTSTFSSAIWGAATDIPTPSDYDNDGRADIAIFRPSDGTWWLSRTTVGTIVYQFGTSGDHPVVGDYDGDGSADIAAFRPSTGVWYIFRSTLGPIGYQFGVGTDKVAPSDYDGDGKTDIAVYRPSEGRWYIVNSASPTYPAYLFGASTDIPTPADYDGDGKADIAIFRPSDGNWWINRTTAGLIVQQFGQNGDRPTPNAFGN
jgi:subtilisin